MMSSRLVMKRLRSKGQAHRSEPQEKCLEVEQALHGHPCRACYMPFDTAGVRSWLPGADKTGETHAVQY